MTVYWQAATCSHDSDEARKGLGAKVGDEVAPAYQGRQAVTVKGTDRDADRAKPRPEVVREPLRTNERTRG